MKPSARSISLFVLLAFVASHIKANQPIMKKSFQFVFDGLPQSLDVDLNSSTYAHYRAKQRTWNYGAYTVETSNYPFIATFAQKLEDAAALTVDNEWDKVRYAVSFVQHIKYADDPGGEYPRYPVETLMEGLGDCEDTAILLAAILDAWGIDCVLLSPPGHMALGVAVDGLEAVYYPFDSRKYFYVETTGKNWDIGEVPPMYKGQAKVIPLLTVSGPRRSVSYVPPREHHDTKLQFAVYRSTNSAGGEGRIAYQYKIRLEGSQHLMDQVREVRYQRQHATFAEYRDGQWLVKNNPENQFEASWTSWRNANIAVQVEFLDGHVSEFLVRESAIEAQR